VNPRLVIFDCDGVLVDSERISNGVLADMLAEHDVAMTLAESRQRFQGRLLVEIPLLVQEEFGVELPEGWLALYEQRRAEVFRRELRPVPGAPELVGAVLDAGVPACVASQGRLSKTDLSLALTGLERLFPATARFSAEQVARGKPHPDLFLHAAEVMGVAPEDCVVVEDTPSGVQAAVAAGMPVYGYCADSDEQALRAAGATTVDSLFELPPLLVGAPLPEG
jgi:HAD superfamily hydrolase (TIGR01509 family)